MNEDLSELQNKINYYREQYLLVLKDNAEKECQKIRDELLHPIINSKENTYSEKTVQDAEHINKELSTIHTNLSFSPSHILLSLKSYEGAVLAITVGAIFNIQKELDVQLKSIQDSILNNNYTNYKFDSPSTSDQIYQSSVLKAISVGNSTESVLKIACDLHILQKQLLSEFSDKFLSKKIEDLLNKIIQEAKNDKKDKKDEFIEKIWEEFIRVVQELLEVLIDEESPVRKAPRYLKKGREIIGAQGVDLSTNGAAERVNELYTYLSKITLLNEELVKISKQHIEFCTEIMNVKYQMNF